MEKLPSERRQYPRIETSILISLRADKRLITATTINLSVNGVCCRVNRPIKVMTCLEIIMMLPSEGAPDNIHYLECDGIVVREENTVDGHTIAIFFNNIKKSERQKLINYIQSIS